MSRNEGKITTACVDLFIIHVLNWMGEMGRMVKNGELPHTTDTSGSQYISQALVEAKVPQGLLQTITAQVGSAACQVLKRYANLRDMSVEDLDLLSETKATDKKKAMIDVLAQLQEHYENSELGTRPTNRTDTYISSAVLLRVLNVGLCVTMATLDKGYREATMHNYVAKFALALAEVGFDKTVASDDQCRTIVVRFIRGMFAPFRQKLMMYVDGEGEYGAKNYKWDWLHIANQAKEYEGSLRLYGRPAWDPQEYMQGKVFYDINGKRWYRGDDKFLALIQVQGAKHVPQYMREEASETGLRLPSASSLQVWPPQRTATASEPDWEQ
jgi:hypothetical protein